MTGTDPAAAPGDWTLPNLRVDVDGDWYDDGVQVTHPGIVANLRTSLRRDGAGYFIQTRARIPGARRCGLSAAIANWSLSRITISGFDSQRLAGWRTWRSRCSSIAARRRG